VQQFQQLFCRAACLQLGAVYGVRRQQQQQRMRARWCSFVGRTVLVTSVAYPPPLKTQYHMCCAVCCALLLRAVLCCVLCPVSAGDLQ
jgi:hypothetical protein